MYLFVAKLYFNVLFLDPVDDVFYVGKSTPTCLSVLANDPGGSTIQSVQNGTLGVALHGVPPFYIAEVCHSVFFILFSFELLRPLTLLHAASICIYSI